MPLDGPYTGGFGEETCHSCHFDYELNREEGSLSLKGVPERWEAGKIYPLVIEIERADLQKGGFQLTIRTADGEQAGRLKWEGERLDTTPVGDRPVTYLQHAEEGTEQVDEGRIRWEFEWVAPAADDGVGDVRLHVAANAGNGDDSPFGDWIYLEDILIQPSNESDGT